MMGSRLHFLRWNKNYILKTDPLAYDGGHEVWTNCHTTSFTIIHQPEKRCTPAMFVEPFALQEQLQEKPVTILLSDCEQAKAEAPISKRHICHQEPYIHIIRANLDIHNSFNLIFIPTPRNFTAVHHGDLSNHLSISIYFLPSQICTCTALLPCTWPILEHKGSLANWPFANGEYASPANLRTEKPSPMSREENALQVSLSLIYVSLSPKKH